MGHGMLRTLSLTALVLLGFAAPARAGLEEGMWSTVAGKGELKYRIVHKLHEIVGTTTAAEGRAMVKGGQVQVQVRVPATAFDSGNINRDSNVQAVIEAAKYPFITLKGTGALCEPVNGACEFPLNAVLDFHGVQKAYTVPVKLTAGGPGRVTAAFRLPVVLTQHAVALPSLLFIPIEDGMNVDGVIEMELKK